MSTVGAQGSRQAGRPADLGCSRGAVLQHQRQEVEPAALAACAQPAKGASRLVINFTQRSGFTDA